MRSEGGTVYLKSLDMTFRGLEEKGRLLEMDSVLAFFEKG